MSSVFHILLYIDCVFSKGVVTLIYAGRIDMQARRISSLGGGCLQASNYLLRGKVYNHDDVIRLAIIASTAFQICCYPTIPTYPEVGSIMQTRRTYKYAWLERSRNVFYYNKL